MPNPKETSIENFIKETNFAERLGLSTKVDQDWFLLCFYARSLRNPETKRSQLLNDPRLPMTVNISIVGGLFKKMIERLQQSEEAHRKSIDKMEDALRMYKKRYYPENGPRAATILSAVNSLIAKGLDNSKNSFLDDAPVAIFDNLDAWGQFWKSKIENSGLSHPQESQTTYQAE